MSNSVASTPFPVNEPVCRYQPGSAEKESLKKRLRAMLAEQIEIPLIIGGKEVRTGDTAHGRLPARPRPRPRHLSTRPARRKWTAAAAAAAEAWRDWSELPWEDRAAVFLRAADLLAGPWRDTLNAATMLSQSKTGLSRPRSTPPAS